MKKVIEKVKIVEPVVRTAPQAASITTHADVSHKPLSNYAISGFYQNSIKKPLAETVQTNLPRSSFFTPSKPMVVLPDTTKLTPSHYASRNLSTSASDISPINKEYLNTLSITENSMPDLLPSLQVPMGFTQQKHFEGALAGALVLCLKEGMTQEEAYLIAAFQFGSPGSNITILQTLSKAKFLKSNMDMLPYLPSFDSVPEIVRNRLAHLPTHEFMFCYETITMLQINQDLNTKLEFYQEKAPLKNSLAVQNLTGNSRPDFVRNFHEPIDTIRQEAYDQKSVKSPLLDNNHIRPVSGNLGDQTNEAVANLATNVQQWSIANGDKPVTLAQNLLDSLNNLKKAYSINQNSQLYASSYNQLRNAFGEFLIKNRIPMNLVTEVSLQTFTVNPQNSRCFREFFIQMHYSSESPWLAFANAQVQNNNAKSINYDFVIKTFADCLFHDLD